MKNKKINLKCRYQINIIPMFGENMFLLCQDTSFQPKILLMYFCILVDFL